MASVTRRAVERVAVTAVLAAVYVWAGGLPALPVAVLTAWVLTRPGVAA